MDEQNNPTQPNALPPAPPPDPPLKQPETPARTDAETTAKPTVTGDVPPYEAQLDQQLGKVKVGSGRPKWLKPLLYLLLVIVLAAGGYVAYNKLQETKVPTPADHQQIYSQKTDDSQGLVLDEHKNYGNKYKDGILPVGDKHYVTDKAKQGYIYMCQANFVPEGQTGAQTRGPWFIGTDKYDMNKKSAVQGSVNWTPSMKVEIINGKRVVTTNDLPNHKTGVFPVAGNDPAYQYDRNPNSISEQSLTYNLNASPTYGDPNCLGGEVGVMLTGVVLFNGFDAGGRDAGAWEVQDACDGHPQNKGEYHYHSLSRCITDQSVHTVIGYALDGFPITGPKVGENNILTTSDLDECHGITSSINLDGKKITSYHYVMTQDFPYSASCFRSPAIQPPGNHETAGQQSDAQQSPSNKPATPPR